MERLPLACEAFYDANFLDVGEANTLFDEILTEFNVTNNTIKMADGSEHSAVLGSFTFTDVHLTSFDALPEVWGDRAPWTSSLAEVRDRLFQKTGIRFQVGRCIYYRNGADGMAFHADLPAYGATDAIASLSLGAEREFLFRRCSDPSDRLSIVLASGSLLFMGQGCQENYEHSLPQAPHCNAARLNLTFRKYGW